MKKYKYHWTFWIPIFGIIRMFYIGFKYKCSGDSYPDKIHPILYPIYQIGITLILFVLNVLHYQNILI